MPDYNYNDPKGWCGDPKRGAAMGRPTIKGDPKYAGPIFMRRVYLIDGGAYDSNGTYFGHGEPLYWYATEDSSIDGMVRGRTRAEARTKVLELYPKARVRRR